LEELAITQLTNFPISFPTAFVFWVWLCRWLLIFGWLSTTKANINLRIHSDGLMKQSKKELLFLGIREQGIHES